MEYLLETIYFNEYHFLNLNLKVIDLYVMVNAGMTVIFNNVILKLFNLFITKFVFSFTLVIIKPENFIEVVIMRIN